MLSRSAKALFYGLAGPAMRANAAVRRRIPSRAMRRLNRAHLGPGQNNYIPGWINCDANVFTARADLWIDLNHPLPFADGSLDAAYSHHVIEHLRDIDGHMRDVFRALRPGGVYRVGGPSGDGAIDRFLANDSAWFGDWPDKRSSIGGKLDNFLLCRGEHIALLTQGFVTELLENAGFRDVTRLGPRRTGHPALFSDVLAFEEAEAEAEVPHTLLVEAVKPV